MPRVIELWIIEWMNYDVDRSVLDGFTLDFDGVLLFDILGDER